MPQPIGPGIGGVSEPVFTAAGGGEAILDAKRVVSTISKVAGWLDGITGRKKAVISERWVQYDPEKLALELRPSGRLAVRI